MLNTSSNWKRQRKELRELASTQQEQMEIFLDCVGAD